MFVVEATEQLSAVVGEPKEETIAEHPLNTFTEIFDGQVMVGLMVSVTVTLCVQVAVFPEPSVTVQTTEVVPKGYVVEAWSLVVEATEQLSEVIGVPKEGTVAEHALNTFTEIFDGQVMVGLMVSRTVTVCVQVAVFPEPSVTVQTTEVVPKGYVPEA